MPADLRPNLDILPGGKSSRFGSDEAWALMDGLPLIVRGAQRLQPGVAQTSVVAAAAGHYADWGLRTIADLSPGSGPLAGLQAALHGSTADQWVLPGSQRGSSEFVFALQDLLSHAVNILKDANTEHARQDARLDPSQSKLEEGA